MIYGGSIMKHESNTGYPFHAFSVRYRLPRPVSRSYEAVSFSLSREGETVRTRWCAAITVRFCAALYQAFCAAEDKSHFYNPPSYNDFKLSCEDPVIPELTKLPVSLLQLAGHYPGGEKKPGINELTAALKDLCFLASYRICVAKEDGLRVLLGPGIEYFVFSKGCCAAVAGVPEGALLLVDPSSGKYISLAPLLIWKREHNRPSGGIYILKNISGDRAYNFEEGVPGSSSFSSPLEGGAVKGVFEGDRPALGKIAFPPVRFKDGAEIEGGIKVHGIIWRGGLSDIYAACDQKSDRPLIIKTYENAGGFDENYYRYLNEEKFSRDIEGPGVVKPRMVRTDTCGSFYLQDFIEGGSLEDLLEYNGVLPHEQVLAYMEELLRLLGKVHEAGIVHNDIKPDNVLLDGDGSLRLIDFGIATNILPPGKKFREGVPPGTPGYMAPELKRGEAPSPSSDLYSAGVVMARMLSGETLSSPEDARGQKTIPPRLYYFLDRTLAPKPEDRFASMEEAAAVLRVFLARRMMAVSLDIEGALVTSYHDARPRPGLRAFLSFCMETFDIIFIYTTLSLEETESVFERVKEELPEGFTERYVFVRWPGPDCGALKDLRRCRVALEENVIIDDMKEMIPRDQHHRHIHVPEFSVGVQYDEELIMLPGKILGAFRG